MPKVRVDRRVGRHFLETIMNQEQKLFHLGDILTITTGRLVSKRHMDGVYDILNFMTRDNLFTHQLGRASNECKPVLLAQHPQLAAVTGDDVTPENFKEWIEARCAEFGEELMVQQLPEHAHEVINPMSELVRRKCTRKGGRR